MEHLRVEIFPTSMLGNLQGYLWHQRVIVHLSDVIDMLIFLLSFRNTGSYVDYTIDGVSESRGGQ